LAGVFNGVADVSWTDDGCLPTWREALKVRGVKVVQDVQVNTLPIAFDTLNINSALKNRRAQLDWLNRNAKNCQLYGNYQIAHPQGRHT
ncbi:hypothetical protein LXA15_17555, partial [Erwinia amylovora]|uniref:hypothetical protein n=1 Tax=Erwinia amylovora TaxID=552 RepID=UPI0020C01F3B